MSKEFGVSINTLLGAPRKLICQCCGMPLEDDRIISHDSDGTLNEDYCIIILTEPTTPLIFHAQLGGTFLFMGCFMYCDTNQLDKLLLQDS